MKLVVGVPICTDYVNKSNDGNKKSSARDVERFFVL